MMTGRLHAQRGAAGSSREQRGAAGRSREQQGAAGSSRSSSTFRSILTHVKAPTPPEEQKCAVYRVPGECGSVHVGETARQMKTCIEEHKRAVMKADPNNAIAEHVWSRSQDPVG